MEDVLLPLGSIVFLEEGTQKLMIVGRGVVYRDDEVGSEVYTDYMGCTYPYGINPTQTIFFNKKNIDKVLFEGYVDNEEERYREVYTEWEKDLKIPKKEV